MDVSSQISGTAANAANSAFDAKLKSGSTIAQAVQAGIQNGAMQAGAAACVGTGVLAGAAPLCALAGGAIGTWLGDKAGDLVDDVGHWLSGIFSSSPPPPVLVTAKDVQDFIDRDKYKANALYLQCTSAEYLVAKQTLDALTQISDVITSLGGTPDPNTILANLAVPVGLIHQPGPTYFTFFPQGDPNHPDFKFPYDWRPPQWAQDAFINWLSKYSDWTQPTAANGIQAILNSAVDLSKRLETESARVVMLLATDAVLQRAYDVAGAPNVTGSVTDAHFAENLVKVWQLLHGVSYGVEFLHVDDSRAPADLSRDEFADALVKIDQLRHGVLYGVAFLRTDV